RVDLLLRRVLRHDPWRPCRPDGAGRVRSRRRGQHRVVDDSRQTGERHGRRDGPGRGCRQHHRDHDPRVQGRRVQAVVALQP
nr:hypothetical protein [Tanacetum cinerariifolium]